MHKPSAMIGDVDVKNFGFFSVSCRQRSFPVAASKQETAPSAPSVQTLPSPTAGVLRVPANRPPPEAGPLMAAVLNLSSQLFSPVSASRHRVTSSLPWRLKTYTFPAATTGEETPSPTVLDHFSVSSFGHALGALKPTTLLSRFGPRHCGQSCAQAPAASPKAI